MAKYAWLISAAIAWSIFLLLVDWSRFKYTIWSGIITSVLQLLTDIGATKLNLYRNAKVIFDPLKASDVFFTFGVVFAVGVLLAQIMPNSRSLRAINILVITVLFCFEEYLFIEVGVLEYLNWNRYASIFIDLLVFTSSTWFITPLRLNRKVSE